MWKDTYTIVRVQPGFGKKGGRTSNNNNNNNRRDAIPLTIETMPVAKGKNKRALAKQTAGTGGKDASSNSSSSKRSKSSQVRGSDSTNDSGSAATGKKKATEHGGTSSAKNSAQGSMVSDARRTHDAVSTVSKKNP